MVALLVVPASPMPLFCAEPDRPQCCSLITRALNAASQLKTGMPRSEVEKAFVSEGGLLIRNETVYVFKECKNIKVTVKFESAASANPEDPNDRVVAISKPFLDYEVKD